MGVPSKRREIVIPVKGKSDKTRKKVGSAGKKSGKKHAMKKPVTPVKKVRRNLFEGNGSKSSPRKHSKKSSSKSERGNLTRRHSIAGNTHVLHLTQPNTASHVVTDLCELRELSSINNTAICVQAQIANIFSRLFTFETARLPIQTARLPLET